MPDSLATEKPGDRVGRYRLVEVIGEGGCGVVYLALQEEPVQRQVALKVIRLGMDTRQMVARFEAERQALAMMDHPNIAKVLDAGATALGRPYFVMESVRGIAITRFCDEQGLSPDERVQLFIKVCQAIQHAHQKGIIHRDIKPSNILVSLQDGAPVPKVIDFGIAKALDQSLGQATLMTPQHALVGTPAYMSPEQAESCGVDVDTRADVYSLGVVFYEMLTGRPPIDREEFAQAGPLKIRRLICDVEPPRPSTRLTAMSAAALAEVARNRRVEVARLKSMVRGDLDWIVMKCLEKDRVRRYETANGLAADLRRYLNHEPITACPPSTAYVLGKLIRKHKLAVAAGSAVAASLVIGLAISSRLYFRERAALREQERLQMVARSNAEKAVASAAQARTEAEKSRQVSWFMKDMIESVGPAAMASESGTWRRIVDKAADQIGKDRLDPGVEWELRTTLGSVYYSLGQKQRAIEMHREALRLARLHFAGSPARIVESLVNLGWVLNQNGQPIAADPLFREGFALAQKHLSGDDPRVPWIKGRLGWNLMDMGNLDEAEPLCREALEKARAHWNTSDPSDAIMPGTLAGYATGLAYVMALRGQSVEAEQLFREAVAAARDQKGGSAQDVSGWIKNLAAFLRSSGRRDEAEAFYREAWELDRTQAPNHPRQVGAGGNLALILRERGENAEADKILSELISTARSLPEVDRPSWANNLAAIGVSAATLGFWTDAATLLQSARQLGADNERLPVHRMAVAWQTKDKAALQKGFDDFIAILSRRTGGVLGVDICAVLALMPASPENRYWLGHLAEAARNPAGASEWRMAATALADFRAGKLDSAQEAAKKAAAQSETGPRTTGHLVLALCQNSAGQKDQGRSSVASARATFGDLGGLESDIPGKKLLDWVIVRALLGEAANAIGN